MTFSIKVFWVFQLTLATAWWIVYPLLSPFSLSSNRSRCTTKRRATTSRKAFLWKTFSPSPRTFLLSFSFSHSQKEDKNGFCFTLELDEKNSTFYCLDENSRDEWVRSIASFCLLRMVTSDLSFSAERLQAFLLFLFLLIT